MGFLIGRKLPIGEVEEAISQGEELSASGRQDAAYCLCRLNRLLALARLNAR